MAFIAPIVTSFTTAISGASVCSSRVVARPRSNAITMKVSQSMPFMECPPALEDSSIPGNANFDPFNLSTVFDLKWMQESEIKHCRIAMLAVLGFIIPEFIQLPGYPKMGPIPAHNYAVQTGGMSQILLWTSFLEVFGTVALISTLKGNRAPGDFCFDPLGLSKDPATKARYQLSEIKNGRLAMCAIGGFVHQGFLAKEGVIAQLTHFQPIQGHVY